jgi:hypothetical protein
LDAFKRNNSKQQLAILWNSLCIYHFDLGKKLNDQTSCEYTPVQIKNKITGLRKTYRKIKSEMEDTGIK